MSTPNHDDGTPGQDPHEQVVSAPPQDPSLREKLAALATSKVALVTALVTLVAIVAERFGCQERTPESHYLTTLQEGRNLLARGDSSGVAMVVEVARSSDSLSESAWACLSDHVATTAPWPAIPSADVEPTVDSLCALASEDPRETVVLALKALGAENGGPSNKLRSKWRFARVNLHGAELQNSNFSEIQFKLCDMSEARLFRSDLRSAFLSRCNLRMAKLMNTKLHGATVRHACLQGAVLADAQFPKADLTGSNFSEATLMRTNFENATLIGVDLRGARLLETKFKGAKTRRARVEGTDLSDALDLTTSQALVMVYDRHTVWPPGVNEAALPQR